MRALEADVRRAPGRPARRGASPAQPSTSSDAVSVPLPLQVIADAARHPRGRLGPLLRLVRGSIPGANDWPPEKRQALRPRCRPTSSTSSGRAPGRPAGGHGLGARPAEVDGQPPHRRRARHVPQPAAGGRQRDHPQRHLRRDRGAGRAPEQWQRLRRRPLARAHRGGGDPALDDAGDLLHAHRHPGHRDPRRRRSPRATRWCCSTPRPTATRTSSAPPPTSSTSGATPTTTWRSASGPTSASGAALARLELRRPARGAARPLPHARARRRGGPHPVDIIAGVRSAPVVLRT